MNPLCHPPSGPAGAASPVERRRRIAAGEPLFAAGSARVSIYALRAGFAKVRAADALGGRHIVRFLLPGDAIGLDGFDGALHRCDAIAVEDCEVCEIPAYRAGILSDFSVRIAAHLRHLLAREVRELQEHSAALAGLPASQRVAAFLLELSRRWGERGYAQRAFRLPMSRRDLGEHLGIAAETASRVLHDLQSRAVVTLSRHGVEIRDPEALGRYPMETSR
jgi:CRP/FNR family transcriptional regulator